MSNPKPLGVAANTSLADLNTIVVQNEQTIGALTAMANEGGQTVLTFDADQYNPAINAVIQVKAGGSAPAGSDQVCEGMIYVSGMQTDCVAYRKR
jgi:hypothetical protein